MAIVFITHKTRFNRCDIVEQDAQSSVWVNSSLNSNPCSSCSLFESPRTEKKTLKGVKGIKGAALNISLQSVFAI